MLKSRPSLCAAYICRNKDDEPTCTSKTSITCSVEDADRQGVSGVMTVLWCVWQTFNLPRCWCLGLNEPCLTADHCPVPDVGGRHHTDVGDTLKRPYGFLDLLNGNFGSTVDNRHPVASVLDGTVYLYEVRFVYGVSRRTDVHRTCRLGSYSNIPNRWCHWGGGGGVRVTPSRGVTP